MIKKLLGGTVVATLIALGLGGVAGASTTALPIPGVGSVDIISGSGPGIFDCAAVVLQSDPSGDTSVCYANGQNVIGENVDVLLIHTGANMVEISFNPLAVCTESGCTGLGSLKL